MSEKLMALGVEVDPAKFLAALFNGTQPLGLGMLQPGCHDDMSDETAANIIAAVGRFSFDYVRGRPIKVHAHKGDCSDSQWVYDRDAGEGQFARAVEAAKVAP